MTVDKATRVEEVAALARQTGQTASEALTWLGGRRQKLGKDSVMLERDFRKFSTAIRRLETALHRPMCVGVFGPSQAGKSYLISALARRGTNPVKALFAGKELDFVAEINPEGGQESTGLVTRFTTRPVKTPPAAPVALRLLSETDLVKILGNTYLSDFDLSAEEPAKPERVRALLEELSGRLGSPVDPLNEDDIFEMQEYFDRYFRGSPMMRSFGTAFWEKAAAMVPRLSVADRGRLFGLLWNELQPFTDLFVRLTEALKRVGFAGEAFCPLEALVPRDTSIIDVQNLNDLATRSGAILQVVTRDGKSSPLQRAEIAALTAELTIVLKDQPWPFFEHTDLLDFPGARSRESIPDPADFVAKPDKLPGLFLRGKVAYLFQRYCAERELTSMLLCIGNSNQEVRTLPGMIKDWIDITHGAEAEERSKVQTALFLVLTKFDTEFEEKAGQADSSDSRWTIRLNASLLDFFGKAHNWPHQWHPGTAFDNTFWLRNPHVKAKHIIEYDAEGNEIGLRASETQRLARLKVEYCGNEAVRKHFAEPERAWDEGMRLNDGGTGYIAEKLAPVCNPMIKQHQVERQLAELRRTMADRLAPYYVNSDVDQELVKRRAQIKRVAVQVATAAEQQRFGKMLRLLQIDFERLMDVYRRIEDGEHLQANDGAPVKQAAPIGARIDRNKLVSAIFSDDDAPPAPPAKGEVNGPADQAEFFASTSLAEWAGLAQRAAEDGTRLNETGMTGETMGQLIVELITGAQRLGLRTEVAKRIRPVMNFRQKSTQAPAKIAIIAQNVINEYVNYLGYRDAPPDRRPRVAKIDRPVFAQRKAVGEYPQLGEEPFAYESDYLIDWLTGLRQLVDDNVRFMDGAAVDSDANSRLGGILRNLAPAA